MLSESPVYVSVFTVYLLILHSFILPGSISGFAQFLQNNFWSATIVLVLYILVFICPSLVFIYLIEDDKNKYPHQPTLKDYLKTLYQTILTIIINIIVLVLVFGFLYAFYAKTGSQSPPPILHVKSYKMVILPKDPLLQTLIITEEVLLEKASNPIITQREITSTARYLLITDILREVKIDPFQRSSDGTAMIVLSNGRIERGLPTIENASIELRNFPLDTFYAAAGTKDLKRLPYLDTETITWTPINNRQSVIFSYIPPSYRILSPIISPLTNWYSLLKWLIAILGMIITSLTVLLIKPRVEEVIKRIADKRFPPLETKKEQENIIHHEEQTHKEEPQGMISVDDAAKQLQISKELLMRLSRNGDINAYYMSNRWWIKQSDLDEYKTRSEQQN